MKAFFFLFCKMAFEIDLNEISELFSFVSETEQQDALDVFDALIEVQDQQHRSFDQDYLLIHCALELNQEMQQETIQHITAIDQQITRISHMLVTICNSLWKEKKKNSNFDIRLI